MGWDINVYSVIDLNHFDFVVIMEKVQKSPIDHMLY